MVRKIIFNEWLQWSRDRRMVWLTGFLLVISLAALWHQLDFQSNLKDIRLKAQEDSRKEWLSQELKHPHMAAHFGNYAYKKPSLLHCFDPGLTIYTGTSVYMEPHRQNDFLFSKSQESDTGLRFGWLSPALICQLLIPLLIIILTFNSINGEYEKGTMSLLLSQGASSRQILFGKTFAVFFVFAIFVTAYLLLNSITGWVLFKTAINYLAIVYLWLVYTFYCFIWSITGVLVSSHIKNVGGIYCPVAVTLDVYKYSYTQDSYQCC
jgi:ABC-2 type transport system permease protein